MRLAPRPREALDRAALLLAFLLGAGGGVALKLLAAPVLLAALWPVAVLLLYVALCLLTRSAAIEPDVIGDNCYYLGFLFTLSSLAVTLYQIRDLSGLDAADARVIPLVVSGFGVALTSTVVGVFLRMMLMGLRPDIVARDREARRDLQAGARDFHAAVAQASRSLKAIAVEAAQHAAERDARLDGILARRDAEAAALLAAQAEAQAQALATLAARASEALATGLGARAGEAAAATQALAQSQEEAARRLLAAQGAVEAALLRWAGALDAQAELAGRAEAAAAAQAEALEARARTIAEAGARQAAALEAAGAALQDRLAEVAAQGPRRDPGRWPLALRRRADP